MHAQSGVVVEVASTEASVSTGSWAGTVGKGAETGLGGGGAAFGRGRGEALCHIDNSNERTNPGDISGTGRAALHAFLGCRLAGAPGPAFDDLPDGVTAAAAAALKNMHAAKAAMSAMRIRTEPPVVGASETLPSAWWLADRAA